MLRKTVRRASSEPPPLNHNDMPRTALTGFLRSNLQKLRDQEVRRLRELVRSEVEHKPPVPGDPLDDARQHEDTELNASLIDMSEKRLAAIFDTFERMETGRYGMCEDCGDEISIERLRAIPTAVYCVDCQSKTEFARRGTPNVYARPMHDEPVVRPEAQDDNGETGRAKSKRWHTVRWRRGKDAIKRNDRTV
jgi:DnaK suppressor protein